MRRPLAYLLHIVIVLLAQTAFGDGEGPSVESPHPHDTPQLVADPSLSLSEVVRLAAGREPGAAVVDARLQEAVALRGDAGQLFAGAPALAAAYVTDGLGSDDGYRKADSLLELPLWWPGQRVGRRDVATAAENAAAHAATGHTLEVAGWVRQAVAELALADNRLELAEAEWRAEEALAAQIERGVALREFAQRDLLLARSASLDHRLRYLEALEASRHRAETYVQLTGLSSWPEDWREPPALRRDLGEHPLLLVAEQEAERAEAELARATSDRWGHPVLALGSEHERALRSLDYGNRLVVGIRIPLGWHKDARGEVAAAHRAAAAARRDSGRLERALREELAHAEHRLTLSHERVSTAREQSRMASEHLRLTQRAFELGETDLGTLLRARARANAAERTSHEAGILQQFSAAQLNQALGFVP